MIINATMVSQRLAKTVESTLSSHAAVRAGIATHAEKHRVKVGELRNKRKHDLAIADGATRNVGKL